MPIMSNPANDPKILVLSAPSGGGKTSLAKALAGSREDAEIVVSHTTRPARPGEIDGVHYHFVNPAAFEALISEQAFIEYAAVYGNLYGTSLSAVNALMATGKHVILDIDWQGARIVRERYPQAVTVFILPPSIDDLEKRLRERNQDSESVIRTRMTLVKQQLSHQDEFEIILVNEKFDESVAFLNKLLESCQSKVEMSPLG